MRPTVVRICFALALAPAEHALGQQVTLRFDPGTNTLEGTVQGSIVAGQDLKVRVAVPQDVTTDAWTFRLGDEVLTRSNRSAEGNIDFVLSNVQLEFGAHQLTFTDGGGLVQWENSGMVLLVSAAAGPSRAPPTSAGATSAPVDCLNTYNRRRNHVTLCFTIDGLLHQGRFPRDVDDNDVIEIFLVSESQQEVQGVRVEVAGTYSADGDLQILGSDALEDFRGLLGTLTAAGPSAGLIVAPVGTFGPYSGPSVGIAIRRTAEDGSSQVLTNYALRINRNFVAAIRFGVGKSDVRFNSYEVSQRADSDTTHIKNVSDPAGETRYFISVVFYGWRLWENRFWNGRDLEERPRLIDRINPFVGLGIEDFGDEWFYGASFEISRGLDIVVGRHRADVQVLDGGFSEGDVFGGEASGIPTRIDSVEKWFLGATVDLRIAVSIVGGIFSGQ